MELTKKYKLSISIPEHSLHQTFTFEEQPNKAKRKATGYVHSLVNNRWAQRKQPDGISVYAKHIPAIYVTLYESEV